MAAENQILTKFRGIKASRRALRIALAKLDRNEIARRQKAIRARRVRVAKRSECDRFVQEVAR